MKRSTKFNQQLAALRADGAKILDAMEAAGDDAEKYAAEKAKLDANKAKIAQVTALRDEAVALEEAERNAPAAREDDEDSADDRAPATRITDIRERADRDARRGFTGPRAFLMAVMRNSAATQRDDVEDERLRPLAVTADKKSADKRLEFMLPRAFTPRGLLGAAGSDEQGTYSDTYGGFAVVPARLPGVLSIGFEGDPTAGRTQPIPMTSPLVEILARTDKDHTSSVSGGFTVMRRAETTKATASRAGLEKVALRASSLTGVAFATDEVLADSPESFVAIIATGFRDQFSAHMLNEKIHGRGGEEFLGVLNSPCLVSVAKETGQAAATINAENVIKMAARVWGLNQAIWLANHDTRPQLAKLSITIGTAGVLLYQPSQQEGFPDMLWGRPIFYTEYCATLGTKGDLIIGNWSQFLEGLYQPLQSAESVHVRFLEHETAFRFALRNAGAPWWRAPLTPAKSSATLSPFVSLDTRA